MTTRFTLNVTSDEMGADGSGMSQNATVASDNPEDLIAALSQLAGVNRASNNYGAQEVNPNTGSGCSEEEVEEEIAYRPEPKIYSTAGGVGDLVDTGHSAQVKNRNTKAGFGDNPLVDDEEDKLGASLMREWTETKLQGVSDEFDTKAAMKAISEGKTEYRAGTKMFAIRTEDNIAKVFPVMENRTLMTMPLLVLDTASLVKESSIEENFGEVKRVSEGTMAHGIFASNPQEAKESLSELETLLQQPLPAGEASDKIGNLIFDDILFDAIGDAEDQDPDMDMREYPAFTQRLQELKSWAEEEVGGMAEGSFNDDGSYNTSDDEANEFDDEQPTEGVNENSEDNPVAGAITRRIMMQRLDLLSKYGPVKVMAAIDEVADFVGDVEEIGSSDVSGWVKHVEQMLGNMGDMDESEQVDELSPGTLGSYVKKASGAEQPKNVMSPKNVPLTKIAAYQGDSETGHFGKRFNQHTYDKAERLRKNREQGITRAVDKLAKEDVTEGVGPEVAQVLAQCGSGELDCYDVMNSPKTPAEQQASKIIQQMYDDVSIDHHLHPDDNFEEIFDIIADQLEQDYGTNEGAHASTIGAMADSVYQPKVGDKIRTRKGGQIPGTVEKVGDQGGIDYCWFRHPEGKMYKTPCSNVMREDMDEGFMDTVKKGLKAVDRVVTGGDKEDLIRLTQKQAGVAQTGKKPEPKNENIEMNEELAQIMALAGMHEAKVDEQDVDENAYNQAAAAAARSGAKEFEFPKGSGKMHPAKMDKDTAHQIGESSKPDYLDLDKDGDKKEPMKDAAKDKEKVDEAEECEDCGEVKCTCDHMDEDFSAMLALAGLSEKKDPEAEEDKMNEASHQADTTMKHVKNPTQGEKDAAKDIKPGVAGYRDRIDMLKSAEKDGRLKSESTIAEDEELAYVKHLLAKWL